MKGGKQRMKMGLGRRWGWEGYRERNEMGRRRRLEEIGLMHATGSYSSQSNDPTAFYLFSSHTSRANTFKNI